MQIYPNPVSDELYFKFKQSPVTKHIKIFTVNGQLLLSKDTYTDIMINIEEFRYEGMLVVKVTEGDDINSSVIIVKN